MRMSDILAVCQDFNALQLIFLFFLQENELRKALILIIGMRLHHC
jgi:hypothetical protein